MTELLVAMVAGLAVIAAATAWGVALGAIVSPTDAVATSIVKQTSVSKRVVAMLDGESLLNDATALVLLRAAIAATAASFSLWGRVGTFSYSVFVAAVIGWAVGRLNLMIRRRVTDPTLNTVISFAVPFDAAKRSRLEVIEAQRAALLDARDNGTFDADVLAHVLATLDASQINIEMRGGPAS